MRQAAAHSACAHAPARGTHRQPATEGLLRRKLGSRGVPASDEQAAARLCLALVRSRRADTCLLAQDHAQPHGRGRPGGRGAILGGVWRTTRGHWPWLDGCAGLSWLPPALEREAGTPRRGERGRQGRRGGEAWAPWSVPGPGSAPPGPSLLTPTQTTASRWRQGTVPPLHRPSCAPSPHPGFLDHPLTGQW